MGREVKRVALDFEWPLEKMWKGYKNPWYQFRDKCPDCDGSGYSPMAKLFADQWYGNAEFDPVAYGSQLLTPDSPGLKAFVERQVDRSIREAAEGTALEFVGEGRRRKASYTGKRCYYTDNGRLTREQAIAKESARLLDMWNQQWNHHLIEADVQALVEDDRLVDFCRRPLKDIPLEEYIRTHAYYLWLEAGCPAGRDEEFWLESEEKHKHHWLPFWNGYMPTPQEVNDWNILTMGHDSINSWVCVKARCEREGFEKTCSSCGGSGDCWHTPDAKENCEKWEREEPPEGPGYQVWENVSEGSPISPVFSDPRILAEWMANSDYSDDLPADRWLQFITGPGWAPSMMMDSEGVHTGVEAMTEES